ncbi:MAG: Asp23/Gls24 family envelope stress response protein [Clostridia bacterium]|nr:Asp23/Gls24 family envelope stress response protein [Clostridia bacterium]MBR6646895.1 Asp23/Gls24 family envelope stress response protein [Clostridia bacterium]
MAVKTENDHGSIVISNNVISRIAGATATTCYGVVGMAYKNASDSIASLLKWDNITKGIKVTTDNDKIDIDLHIIVEYGINIKVISESIISNVRYTVENMTGFKVGKVTINVEGIRID